MFRGRSFIVSTMQEETTPIFKRLWYDWTQQQPGIEPTNPLGQCWVPLMVAVYDQQGLLRTYSLPGGSIRSPHPGSPRGRVVRQSIPFSNCPLNYRRDLTAGIKHGPGKSKLFGGKTCDQVNPVTVRFIQARYGLDSNHFC